MSYRVRLTGLRTEWWVVALLSTVIAIFLVIERVTERLDSLAYDLIERQQRYDPDPRILLVTIDQRSLEELGPWPWPRERHARLIEMLARNHPKAIAYDVLFIDPGPDDAALGAAIALAPLHVPMLFDVPGKNGRAYDKVLPVEQVRRGTTGVGHVNLVLDTDGVIRRIRRYEGIGEAWPHLMELVRRTALDLPIDAPAGDTMPLLISYAGPPGHFPSIDAATVLRGEVPAELLRDRLILVGATAQGLGDYHATAVSHSGGAMSGLEIQANFLNDLLTGRIVREGGLLSQLLFTIIPLWLLLLGFSRLRPRAAIALCASLALIVMTVTAVALLGFHFWLPPTTALVTLAIVYALWGWRRLAAVSGYMIQELEALRSEPNAFAPAGVIDGPMDPVSRQTALLNVAITQMRDMRRFVTDSLNQLPDAIFVADTNGLILLGNDAGRALNAQFGDGGSNLTSLLSAFQHADRGRAGEAGNDAIAWPPGQPESHDQMLLGGELCFDLRATERLAADGQRVGWIMHMVDITQAWQGRKEREETLRFLSHDIRTPLASILALIAASKSADLSPELSRRLSGHAQRSLDLADGFIHLARAQMLDFQMRPLNLPDLMQDAVDELWPQITAHKISIVTEGDDQELLAMGERTLLTRALINLIDNAIKYAGDGSKITCSCSRGRIDRRPAAVCRIADNGAGLSADQVDTLLGGFQRGPASHQRGAGLGLSFVQTVVQRHGGQLHCDSAPGQGAAFTIALPLAIDVGDAENAV